MPKIPYVPYPTTQLVAPGNERISVATPPAVFGENIGAGMEHLGAAIEHLGVTEGQAGEKLFDTAEGFQQLKNENEARELQTEHAQLTAPLVADFDAMESKKARDELEPHLKRLQEIRDNLAGKASNPAVRRSFLNDTAGFMQRETFSAARHAGDEYRKYTIGNLTATQSLNLEGVRRYPDDVKAVNKAIMDNINLTNETLAAHGVPLDSPAGELARRKAVSTVLTHRIDGVNDTNPAAAATMLEDRRADLLDEDYKQLEGRIKSQSRSIDSANIANDTIEWGKEVPGVSPAKTEEEMIEHARELANDRHPKDPQVAIHAIATLRGQINADDWAKKKQDYKDRDAIEQVLLDPNIKTAQQVKASPGMKEIIQRLGPKYENGLQSRINTVRASEQKATREQAFNRLQGLWDWDREEFLNTDLTKEGLSFQDFKYWTLKRSKALEEPQGDLRVHRAHSLMQGSHAGELEALGIFSRTQTNKDDFDKYSGALSSALDVWQEDHGGKRATDKEIREIIGPQVIQTHAAPGMFGFLGFGYTRKGPFGYDTPFYQQDLSTKEAKDWMEKKREELLNAGGAAPSDKQLEQAYTRYQYIKNYSKPSKGDKGGPPKPPRESINE